MCVPQWSIFSLAKCKLNEYTAITQFLVISLRLAAIILAGFRFHFCASNVLKYTEEKLVTKKKKYLFQFVFSGMTFSSQIQGRQGSSSISTRKEGEEKNKRKGNCISCLEVAYHNLWKQKGETKRSWNVRLHRLAVWFLLKRKHSCRLFIQTWFVLIPLIVQLKVLSCCVL